MPSKSRDKEHYAIKPGTSIDCAVKFDELNEIIDIRSAMIYDASDEVIRFFVPENLQYTIFNGASILGSLPSFQSLFVTYEEFKTNSAALYKNISEIF